MSQTINIKIGEDIRSYLEGQGLQQQEIADRIGISQSAVSAYYRGKPFGKNAAAKWAEAFGFRANWLITGEGPMLTSDQPENPAEIEPDMTFIKNRLMKHIESQDATISSLLDLLKAEREKVERLEEELRTYREHKGETATAAAASSVARAV